MADPDLELREGGGGAVFVLLALPSFLSSVIFFFLTQNKGGTGPWGPSSRSVSDKVNAW